MAAKKTTGKAAASRVGLEVKTRATVEGRDDDGEKFVRQYDVPEVAQAASLGLALLTEGGCNTWTEFVDEDDKFRVAAFKKVVLTDDQLDLLERFPVVLTWISRASTPASTVAVCPDCEQFSATLSTTPSSCKVSPGCPGKPVRVLRAPRVKKTTNATDSTDA